MLDKPIFALDIGTRTVIGLVCRKHNNNYIVEGVEIMEHQSRSMIDGQIHHIEQVTTVVQQVKENLEKKTGFSLEKVAVAAAGRTLKTIKHLSRKEIVNTRQIDKNDVLCLEIEAVGQAQKLLAQQGQLGEGINSYHCVGYSTINYFLEDNIMGDLVGQYGQSIGVHIIATFLPRIVVDSLYTVLKKADLEMTSLTLEPIAAAKIVIPPSMRQLNIALVDIGAGTSDIAICKDGNISSYAMVPIAGDELTEALCHQYLLDFNEGEKIKRLLSQKQVEMLNILGEKNVYLCNELISSLEDVTNNLAEKITREIINVNEKEPQAVFCIGGGSQFPYLAQKIAVHLGLSPQRAAVKGNDILSQVEGNTSPLIGPEAITPLGIAFTADEQVRLMKAEVNGRIVSFLNNTTPTVADAILAADIDLSKLHGKPGMSITLEVNDQIKIVKGDLGTRPQIQVDSQEAQLNTEIVEFNKITVQPGKNGKDAEARVKDIIPQIPSKKIIISDSEQQLISLIYMNGEVASLDQLVVDGAKIKYNKLETVADVLYLLGYKQKDIEPNIVNYYLNNTAARYVYKKNQVYLNGILINDMNYKIHDLDKIEIVQNENPFKCIKDLISGEPSNSILITVNKKELALKNKTTIFKNSKKANLEDLVLEGDRVSVSNMPDTLIMADVLNHVNFKPTPHSPTAKLIMLVNNNPAEFVTEIKSGDNITLEWA